MVRSALFALALVSLGGLAGCGKASVEDCRKAVMNLQKLRGLDTSPQAPDPEAAVRKCRATANPRTVACLIAAKSAAEADACEPAPGPGKQ
jgi:hypothetical protein